MASLPPPHVLQRRGLLEGHSDSVEEEAEEEEEEEDVARNGCVGSCPPSPRSGKRLKRR